jgi:crotonobetainyl-CoA:carnitine CoA-transferase CaiB-like acyl-CoA transferase
VAALFARERTGAGQRIDVSLLDSQVALMSYVASNHMVSGKRPKRYGNAHPNIVPYEAFKAKDGYFAFAAGNDLQWATFCRAVERPQWIEDERFATNPARNENRKLLIGLLNELFSEREVSDWLAMCEQIGLSAAPINSMDQVFADPQVQARGLRFDIPHPSAGSVPMVASPLNIPTTPCEVRYPPPLLGQHTDEVLQELLGYDQAAIDALREEGVV